jgi:hypothetical protein
MNGAKSELVVPSGHSAHQNPKAIQEVRRILVLDAEDSEARQSSSFKHPYSRRVLRHHKNI